jgi:hypothetical protein
MALGNFKKALLSFLMEVHFYYTDAMLPGCQSRLGLIVVGSISLLHYFAENEMQR